MREIKLRYRLKLMSDDWGDYKEGDIDTFYFNLNNESDGLHRFCIDERWEVISRDEYTGLKDKNGVEIYEGDIVIEKWNNSTDELQTVVEDVRRAFDYVSTNRTIEVIGNIHENK